MYTQQNPTLQINKLFERVRAVHIGGYNVIDEIFGDTFENSGNIGVFCQSQVEFEIFDQIKKFLTKEPVDQNQKYFELLEPIKINFKNNVINYTHLYIRKPDTSEYGKNLGDIDLRLDEGKFEQIYQKVLNKVIDPRVGVYNYGDLKMLEVQDLTTPALAYLGIPGIAEKMRFSF